MRTDEIETPSGASAGDRLPALMRQAKRRREDEVV